MARFLLSNQGNGRYDVEERSAGSARPERWSLELRNFLHRNTPRGEG
jgi:hypothetical protein